MVKIPIRRRLSLLLMGIQTLISLLLMRSKSKAKEYGIEMIDMVVVNLYAFEKAVASGLYLYTIISIGQGIYKRLGILSAFILAPFVLLAIIFAPAANGPIGIVGMICFALAFAFDISNIFQHLKVLRSLKKQKGSKQ